MSFYIDASNKKSLTTITGGWTDLSGNFPVASFTNATFSAVNGGIVTFAGTLGSSASTAFTLTPQTTFDCWVKMNTASTSGTDPANMIYTVQYTQNVPIVGKVQSYLNFRSNGGLRLTWLYYNTPPGPNNGSAATYFLDSPTGILQTNTWYNITTTLNVDTAATTSTGKIYVNGTQVASYTTPAGTTTFMNPSDVIRIANYNSDNNNFFPFNGSISNFRSYARILTDAEIQQNYYAMLPRFRPDVAELAVVHLDAANRNSFTRVEDGWSDLSTLRPALTLSGATYNSSNGGIITFDGNLGSSASTAAAITQTAGMTWDVWFNRAASTNTYNMVFSNTNLPYLSFLSTGGFLFSWYTQNTGSYTQRTLYSPSTAYSNGVWYNVTCTLVQDTTTGLSTGKMYVNGQIVAFDTPTTPPILDAVYQVGRMRVANYQNPSYPFQGSISNLRVYNRVLTDAEILQSYKALAPRFGY